MALPPEAALNSAGSFYFISQEEGGISFRQSSARATMSARNKLPRILFVPQHFLAPCAGKVSAFDTPEDEADGAARLSLFYHFTILARLHAQKFALDALGFSRMRNTSPILRQALSSRQKVNAWP